MAIKQPKRTVFPLPSPVDNGTRLCVKVVIPNIPGHREAFLGAVYNLTRPYSWANDASHSALEVAQVWQSLFDDLLTHFWDNDCSEGNDMGCCYDVVEHRTTPEGHLEIRINGGAWIPDPNDPRITGIQLPPPVIDDHHTKCDAATNGLQHIMDFVAQESEGLQAAASITALAIEVATLIVALFFGQLEAIPIIVPLILVSIVEVFNLGQAAWDAYFTSDVEDNILCALYCSVGEDGLFTQGQMDGFISRLQQNMPDGIAKTVLIDQLTAAGLISLNNMVSYGTSADADCSACDCNACADLSFWTDNPGITGTITARDASSITVQADFYSGFMKYTAQVIDPTNGSHCCSVVEIVDVSGIHSLPAYNECGDATYSFSQVAGGSCDAVVATSDTPFTVKYVFG